jgi:YcaO cyclodehydratase, ATP-ad Mg2+-binding
MRAAMLNTTFRTLVTEAGTGTLCTTHLRIRPHSWESEPERITGLGFGVDGLSARFAAEGEALERATWRWGALWNNVTIPAPDCEIHLPEEIRVTLSARQLERLVENPGATLPICTGGGERTLIPSQAVFFLPRLAPDFKYHRVTSGWAYHVTKKRAIGKGYMEVIERDLQMLFWLGKLQSFLRPVPEAHLHEWGLKFGLDPRNHPLKVVQMAVNMEARFGGTGYFTMVIHAADKPPYTSIGSSLSSDPHRSFCSAMGECLMLRSHQYELVMEGTEDDSCDSFRGHTIRAAQLPEMRDKTLALIAQTGGADSLQEERLDYRKQSYMTLLLRPPPVINHGVVAKVWIDGCQGMVPAGFPHGVTERWRSDWGVTTETWEANRWHPFP